MSDISDRLSDADWYIYHGLEEYFENIEHTSVWSGLGDCLLIYMKSKKRTIKESKTSKNMKKNVVKINENQLHSIIAECMEKVLMEDYNKGVDMEISDEEQRKKHILKLDKERKLSNAMIYFKRAQKEIRKGISQLGGKHKVEIYLEGESSFLPIPGTDYKCVGNIRIDGEVVG